ncbi:MAG: flagellar motor switch protein FliN [Candidatus Margulisbacteria bacterium GWF2_38_17]|nr:MAG: flagellar motor switch protein FliN [Candidatus Margulisbacteria bacterium GWD2_39_127]OGI04665.1 MAG: flagellar motor switch protein FliN [Candidatus Margulisbacteria bacterium GWF2_38_17]OGI11917.1 MAG: flagellar motor switch protein FliN [Candidatus Margulisbacteria bacterium GWE2_39_32]
MIEFPDLHSPDSKANFNSDIFDNIPVKVTAELGSSMVSLKDVYELSEGAIIELDRHAGEPLDLLVNGQLVAQGEVVAVDNNYGIRIKTIIKNKK